MEIYNKKNFRTNPEFMKTREGKAFSLNRPAYRDGTSSLNFTAQKLPPQIRAGLGNRDITRNNFISSIIRPRNVIDFDRLQAIDIETQGQKVQLSDKTIQELFKIKVPDPQDITWIAERNRMIAAFQAQGLTPEQIEIELNTNKPLGREQRKINREQSISQSSLSINEKINELAQEVKEGRAESKMQQATIIGQLASTLNNASEIERLTPHEVDNLATSIERLNIPTDYKQIGLGARYIGINYYDENSGLINLLLMNKAHLESTSPEYNINYPVINFSGDWSKGISLRLMISYISDGRPKKRRYLDLGQGGVINGYELSKIVYDLPRQIENREVDIPFDLYAEDYYTVVEEREGKAPGQVPIAPGTVPIVPAPAPIVTVLGRVRKALGKNPTAPKIPGKNPGQKPIAPKVPGRAQKVQAPMAPAPIAPAPMAPL